MKKEMNSRQSAKFNMYRVTEKHLDDHDAIVAAMPAFQSAVDKFKANIASITDLAQLKSVSLTGIAVDKNNSKQALCKLAAGIAGVIYAFATATSNNTLKNEMKLPFTELMRTRDEALVPRCQSIHTKAVANLAALNDYGISSAMLTNLQVAIDKYSDETIKPRTAISGRKTVTATVAELFKETDDILKNQLDKFVELLRDNHSNFVNTYESVRTIVDPPTKLRTTETVVNQLVSDSGK